MLTIKIEGIDSLMQTLDPRNVQLAARASINRAADSGKSVSSQEIRKVYNVKASDISPRLKVSPARMDNMKAVLEISGRPMSLSYFGAKQIMAGRVTSRGKNGLITRSNSKMRKYGPVPQGVRVEVVKGKPTVLRHAFMSQMKKSGHIGVFRRAGKSSLPIYEKNVITITSMISNADVMPSVLQRIQDRLHVEFPRQLDYYMNRGKR